MTIEVSVTARTKKRILKRMEAVLFIFALLNLQFTSKFDNKILSFVIKGDVLSNLYFFKSEILLLQAKVDLEMLIHQSL